MFPSQVSHKRQRTQEEGSLAAEIALDAKSRRAAKQSASRGGTGNGKPPVQTTLLTESCPRQFMTRAYSVGRRAVVVLYFDQVASRSDAPPGSGMSGRSIQVVYCSI